MKKLFFSLMAATALCAGLVSCDAAEELIMEKLVEPAFQKWAGSYDGEDGSTLELTESGNYVYTTTQTAAAPATRAEGKKVVLVGTFTIDVDGVTAILGGPISGKVDSSKGTASIKVAGVEVSMQANKNTTQVTNSNNAQFCRTWNIDESARIDNKKVTISADEYAEYFGDYGYPKQLIISALGTFCVVCSKENYAGTWKVGSQANSIYVAEGTFKGEVPFNVGETVKVSFNAADNKGKTHLVEAILRQVDK